MSDATLLLGTAASIGFVHTLLGIDHSLPFVVLGKAQGWSLKKTLTITGLCGIGHVASSVVLGAVGIGAGVALERLELIESSRGDLAAWLLIAFGLTYASWAGIRALRGRTHAHAHAHHDGTLHDHEHDHHREHLHAHAKQQKAFLTFWTLFVIFAFGPCEALIPILMAPAWAQDWTLMIGVVALFSSVTVATMLGSVTALYKGVSLQAWRRLKLEKWADSLAGLIVAASGGLILAGL